MNDTMASFDWSCPFCGTRSNQHTLDCTRNSEENRRLRQALGQCLPDGSAIDAMPSDQPAD